MYLHSTLFHYWLLQTLGHPDLHIFWKGEYKKYFEILWLFVSVHAPKNFPKFLIEDWEGWCVEKFNNFRNWCALTFENSVKTDIVTPFFAFLLEGGFPFSLDPSLIENQTFYLVVSIAI